MRKKRVNLDKRRFMTLVTSAFAASGALFAALPFVQYMTPSRKARIAGGPIEVDISKLAMGEQKTILWQGKPIWIIKRTPEQIQELSMANTSLRDPLSFEDQQPDYARNFYRSRQDNPEILVLVGVCTHLGCAPTYRPDRQSIEKDWEGGFFCSCHGSKFDLSGRVFKNVPAPLNLVVPPYAFKDSTTLVVGVSSIGDVV
ncbi:MAG: ubiquinol-cytochrome c reductase iron-sulfur subunit [Legionellales bacterium]|nr:ubiquinol-cytochrome c reductase iron-sulfur subunit [Legionellales bacterium]|tara:strand:+ start:764 stop:1363 length:600 start_codon:yes stop_codon:yes gene_type:complete